MTDPQFAVVRKLLSELDLEVFRLVHAGHLDWRDKNLPDDIRSRLLILGASISDYVFWVRQRSQPDDIDDTPESQMYWAEEMEAGTGAWGISAREALDRYLSDDMLDRRRYTDHRGLQLEYPE